MPSFIRKTRLPVPPAEAYRWHSRPGALQRLTPPWERTEILGIDGAFPVRRVVLSVRFGPFRKRWVARHVLAQEGFLFRDVQEAGPFARWVHTHRFVPDGPHATLLVDEIDYELPGGALGRWLGGGFVRDKLERLFDYRHRVTTADLSEHAASQPQTGSLRVLVTGASGLVGSALVPFLETGGHEVLRLGRGAGNELRWDPGSGELAPELLDGIDAVVHLAGANVGARWTSARKRAIRDSRLLGTRLLCAQLAAMPEPPRVLVCASGVGFYGDRGDAWLDEWSDPGTGFLSELSQEMDDATEPARQRGVRVVFLRFGTILTPVGGALARLLPVFRAGLGGRIGSGRQHMSWITIDDAVGAILRTLVDASLHGPVNAVAPNPVTQAVFARTLGSVLGRPAHLPVPTFVLRALFGEMAEAVLLASARVLPRRLRSSDYAFRFPDLEDALRHLLGKPRRF